MKAIVYEKYGPPSRLALRDVDAPPVADNEVRIRVRAAGVARGDWHMLTGTPWPTRLYWGLTKPKRSILGFDAAGTVDAVGARATRFAPGEAVFATSDRAGAFAELVCVRENLVVPRPAGLTDEEAAAAPVSALTALHGLRDRGRIRSGHQVLIIGASGGVGTFAVQIAKSFGAEVTGVCSTRNVEMVQSIGADRVVDYTREDVARGDARYDVILDLVGTRSLADCKRLLTPRGIYVAAAGPLRRTARIALTGGKRMVFYVSQPNPVDMVFLRELLEAGAVRPVIDRRYALEEVPEAIAYVGEGHARGKVVITV